MASRHWGPVEAKSSKGCCFGRRHCCHSKHCIAITPQLVRFHGMSFVLGFAQARICWNFLKVPKQNYANRALNSFFREVPPLQPPLRESDWLKKSEEEGGNREAINWAMRRKARKEQMWHGGESYEEGKKCGVVSTGANPGKELVAKSGFKSG